ncbi:30S ribosomal protein S8 [Polyangium spumosum]|uniref:Small ribosomal subunit protein uS8 n=1 Tax=Polyangium spumosum TaxID=889282 RepID=A0A6N7PWR4_9BACT|nr:30S ribosomal protein S8 [Polyangium spumosum]MRG94534.1 30S ribosomal protein S8 [Polyangium spumosum]
MMTDPIADMLTRIRNAALARHDRTEVPASKMKQAVAEILKSEGYIADVRPSESNSGKLTIVLKYGRDRSSAIDGVRRVSRPGRRVYVKHDRIPRVLSGLGISILSTSHGLMSDRDARKNKLGGELLCEVW